MVDDQLITPEISRKLRGLSLLLAIMIVLVHSGTTVVYFTDGKVEMASQTGVFAQRLICRMGLAAVPAFYLISGLLFFAMYRPTREVILRKYRSRIWSLLLPYLLWSAMAIAACWAVQSVPSARVLFPNPREIVADMTPVELAKTWLAAGLAGQLWFLRYLMLMVALAPLLYVAISRAGRLVAPVVLAVWLSAVAEGVWHYLLEALAFFCLGAYLAIRRPIRLDFAPRGAWLLLWVWLALAAWDTYLGIGFRDAHPLRQATTFVGVAGLWLSWRALRVVIETPPALRAARYSFFLYAAHLPAVVLVIRLVVLGIGRNDTGLAVAAVVSPTAVIALALLAGWALRTLCPPAYRLLSGGR